MKKFLALVLALVMTMSLVTISAGAEDFTDDASITYEEAVDVMTAIGVVGGYADGSFNPTGTLTRGAAAKIICNMILGPTQAGALATVEAPFKDVPADHVFSGYIAYCASEGIVSGYADGTFRPAGTLTGYAFMKMLLCALGYDQVNEEYVGANFAVNVAKRALSIGLADGLDGDFYGTKALTREEACLYAFNALQAQMVEYDNDSKITIGDIVISNSSKATGVTKIVSGTEVPVYFKDRYFSKLVGTPSADAFNAPATDWAWKNSAVGTYTDKADATFNKEVTYGDLYTVIGSNALGKLENVTVFVDGKQVATEAAGFIVANITKGSETKIGYDSASPYTADDTFPTGNGVKTAVYVDEANTDNTKYDVVITIINTYVGKISKVTAETAKKDRFVTLNSSTTLFTDVADVNGSATMVDWEFTTEDFAKDDYVTYTAAETATANTYKVQSVALVEKAGTSTVTAYKNTSAATNFTAGGEVYEYNKVYNTNGAIALDNEIDIYVDENGYVVLTELYNGAVDLAGYLVITNEAYSSTLSTSVIASAVTLDGKELSEITIGKLNGTKVTTTGTVSQDTVYSFSVAEDGKYNLKAVAAPYTQATVAASTPYSTGAASFDSTVVNSATKFIVNNTTKGTVTVYDGIKNMVNVAAGNMTIGAKLVKNGKAVAVYMEVTATTSNASAAEDLVYILDSEFVATKDGDDVVYTYAAVVNGKVGTISTKDVTAVAGDVAQVIAANGVGLYYISNYDGAYVGDNGLVVAGTTSAPAVGANAPSKMAANKYTLSNKVVTYADEVLAVDTNSFVVAKDCAVYSITDKGVMTEIDITELENDNSSYAYWVVTLTENSVTEAVAVYLQK